MRKAVRPNISYPFSILYYNIKISLQETFFAFSYTKFSLIRMFLTSAIFILQRFFIYYKHTKTLCLFSLIQIFILCIAAASSNPSPIRHFNRQYHSAIISFIRFTFSSDDNLSQSSKYFS